MLDDWLVEQFGRIYGHRRWIVATEVNQSAVRLAGELRDRFGAEVLAVGARNGTGAVDPEVPLVSIDLPEAGTIGQGLASAERALTQPSGSVQAAVDRFDPGGQARVIGSPLMAARELVGRPVFGARSARWVALEDKLAIEPLLQAAGLRPNPVLELAATDRAGLLRAHQQLATGQGTVWAGDNRSGVHGGGEGTFWVPDEATAAERAATMGERFDRVRVMPFVEGVPCSIHGLVTSTGEVAVFRPCEQLIFRDPTAGRFVYGRASTCWDPSPADRAEMVDAARRLGAELISQVGYRGLFTLDGVLGADGFTPTEVNPRPGAALPPRPVGQSGQPVSMALLNLAVIEEAITLDAADFERWLVPILDRDRRASVLLLVDRSVQETRRAHLVPAGDGRLQVTEAGPDEPKPAAAIAVVEWGPGPGGSLLHIDQITIDDDGGFGLPIGQLAGPRIVEWLQLVGRHWDLDLPPLQAANPVD